MTQTKTAMIVNFVLMISTIGNIFVRIGVIHTREHIHIMPNIMDLILIL